MKFEATPAFDTDYRRLKPEHQRAFRALIQAFAAACDQCVLTPGYRWPAALRVSPLKGTAGIWEITWSFASPDGRAAFALVTVDGELRCRWRRVGDHDVFRAP